MMLSETTDTQVEGLENSASIPRQSDSQCTCSLAAVCACPTAALPKQRRRADLLP